MYRVSGVNLSRKSCKSSLKVCSSLSTRKMAKPRTKPPVSDEPITQRIHVGGLAASVTPKELVARFSSFGQIINGVQGVSGLGTSLSGK